MKKTSIYLLVSGILLSGNGLSAGSLFASKPSTSNPKSLPIVQALKEKIGIKSNVPDEIRNITQGEVFKIARETTLGTTGFSWDVTTEPKSKLELVEVYTAYRDGTPCIKKADRMYKFKAIESGTAVITFVKTYKNAPKKPYTVHVNIAD